MASEVKTGTQTTEFWGKTVAQVLTLVAMFLPGAHIDPQVGFTIVGALEIAYNLGRSIVKAFSERAKAPVVVPEGAAIVEVKK